MRSTFPYVPACPLARNWTLIEVGQILNENTWGCRKNEFGRTVRKQQNYDNLLNCMPRRREGREGRGEKQNSDRWTGEAKKVRGNVANCQGKGMSKIPAHTKDEFKPLGANK